jgi:hypothetical protein
MNVRASLLCCVALAFVWSCANPPPELEPPPYEGPRIESAGAEDPQVASAVDAAVSAAQALGYFYDASQSAGGLVTVIALAHGEPVTFTLRFIKQAETLVVASAMTQSAGAALQDAGRRTEQRFFEQLAVETQLRSLGILPHPAEQP